MEAAVQATGLLSLPSTPRPPAATTTQRRRGLAHPLFYPKPLHGPRTSFSPTRPPAAFPSPALPAPRRNPVRGSYGLPQKQGNFPFSEGAPSTERPALPHLLGGDGLRRRGQGDGGGVRHHPQTCSAGTAVAGAAADGGASAEPKTKLLGVEVTTLKKIVPLGLMFFCILFTYTILRDTKDVLVVTARGSSAEIIPFLKTWVNLPLAIGFMLLYSKLSDVLSKEALFYTVITPFIAFFGVFGFIMYPLSNAIHPTALADKLLAVLGPRFLGPVAMLRIWSFCLFYVMAELWGSVVISLLFWGFANQITTVDEAKQFYPLFGLGANIALIFSGRTVKYFSNLRRNLGPGG